MINKLKITSIVYQAMETAIFCCAVMNVEVMLCGAAAMVWIVPGWVEVGVAWSDGRVGCCGDSQKVHG